MSLLLLSLALVILTAISWRRSGQRSCPLKKQVKTGSILLWLTLAALIATSVGLEFGLWPALATYPFALLGESLFVTLSVRLFWFGSDHRKYPI